MSAELTAQLDAIFKPSSVAILGASNTPGKWGYRVLSIALKSGFRGSLYPVNPREPVVQGLPAYKSIEDVPGQVDLAVFVVPAPAIPDELRRCIRRGVRGGIIITAGFAETSAGGKALQDQAVAIAREAGFRFVGPNCMGIWSSSVSFNIAFEPNPKPGPVAFVSQSGTFGAHLARVAIERGYGLSKFISIGNQADLIHEDYLEYLLDDPDTRAIIFYIEGLKDGRRFFELAREGVKRKPILVYKAGRTAVGARSMLSHTASIAGADEVFDAMCRQSGVLRGEEVMHPFDVAVALTSDMPLPHGNRVGILGSGGQCVVTSDSCARLGLQVPELAGESQEAIKRYLDPQAPQPRNPVDFAGGSRDAEGKIAVVEALVADPNIDLVITNVPTITFGGKGTPEEREREMGAIRRFVDLPHKYGKPLICMSFRSGGIDPGALDAIAKAGIPSYTLPEECARAAAALVQYGRVKRGE